MRQVIDKSYLDWSRDKQKQIRAKGAIAVAMLSQKNMVLGSSGVKSSARCVWPLAMAGDDSRYISKRMWSK